MAELADARDSKSRILWMWGFDSPSGYCMYSKINVLLASFAIFLLISIFYLYLERDIFGERFINEVRYSDRENILILVEDKILIDIGKDICVKIDDWEDMDISNEEIAKEINNLVADSSFEVVQRNDNLITFIRYQSIAELCPSKIDNLSKLIDKVSVDD